MAKKVGRIGYYRPNTLRDTKEFTNKCIKCQMYALVSHTPPKRI